MKDSDEFFSNLRGSALVRLTSGADNDIEWFSARHAWRVAKIPLIFMRGPGRADNFVEAALQERHARAQFLGCQILIVNAEFALRFGQAVNDNADEWIENDHGAENDEADEESRHG